jgi:hypothetical protein
MTSFIEVRSKIRELARDLFVMAEACSFLPDTTKKMEDRLYNIAVSLDSLHHHCPGRVTHPPEDEPDIKPPSVLEKIKAAIGLDRGKRFSEWHESMGIPLLDLHRILDYIKDLKNAREPRRGSEAPEEESHSSLHLLRNELLEAGKAIWEAEKRKDWDDQCEANLKFQAVVDRVMIRMRNLMIASRIDTTSTVYKCGVCDCAVQINPESGELYCPDGHDLIGNLKHKDNTQ